MGFYSDVLFPGAYDFLIGLIKLDDERRESLRQVRGCILEIGIGTGLNLPLYPEEIQRICAIDPSPGMLKKLARKLPKCRVQVEAQCAGAENLPYPDDSFDTVVSTLVLCSVPDRVGSLAEVRRVLRPDGRFVFLEHGLSPDEKVAKWQRRLNCIQRRFAVGCLLDVPVRSDLESAGFRFEHLKESYLEKGPKTHTYFYEGIATPLP